VGSAYRQATVAPEGNRVRKGNSEEAVMRRPFKVGDHVSLMKATSEFLLMHFSHPMIN
jgi:hypothetical protein